MMSIKSWSSYEILPRPRSKVMANIILLSKSYIYLLLYQLYIHYDITNYIYIRHTSLMHQDTVSYMYKYLSRSKVTGQISLFLLIFIKNGHFCPVSVTNPLLIHLKYFMEVTWGNINALQQSIKPRSFQGHKVRVKLTQIWLISL